MKYLKNVATLRHDPAKCTGCGMCLLVCPHRVFETDGSKVRIRDLDRCMECGACMLNCPFDAIEVHQGVGCAAAILLGMLTGEEPSCG
jgi:NAD-dependent dihydropyrimidine dehydrogenase PreA subunit